MLSKPSQNLTPHKMETTKTCSNLTKEQITFASKFVCDNTARPILHSVNIENNIVTATDSYTAIKIVNKKKFDRDFPSIDQVIPSSFTFEREIDVNEAFQIVKAAVPLSKNDPDNKVRFEVSDDGAISISIRNEDGTTETQLGKTGGVVFSQLFNSKFLLKIFSEFKRAKISKVFVKYNQEKIPVVFHFENDLQEITTVVMPLKR